MSASLEVIVLGSGTSHGIPMIACDCAVCNSTDPRDRRCRASVAVRLSGGEVLLIDVSPEFRLAAVACGLDRLDAIALTHAHADHIMGLDDIRRFNTRQQASIPCYGNAQTLEIVERCFGYAVGPYRRAERPSVELIDAAEPFAVGDVKVTPIPLKHGRLDILGFRIGNFAYCTDCSEIPPASWPLLADLDVLMLDALRYTPHPTHLNLPAAVEVAGRLRPRRTVFTHLTHEISHAATSAELPAGMELAYDGMRFSARC